MKIFLDTNILLDYIENRDREVSAFVSDLLNDPDVVLLVSFYNLVEALDKLQEIYFIGKLLHKRLSFNEILRKRTQRELRKAERDEIQEELFKFITKNKIQVYYLNELDNNVAIDLISDNLIESQDSLIVATYITSDADIFLTNDSNLVKSLKDKVDNLFHLKENLNELKKYVSIN